MCALYLLKLLPLTLPATCFTTCFRASIYGVPDEERLLGKLARWDGPNSHIALQWVDPHPYGAR
jgi:hypothetical protein